MLHQIKYVLSILSMLLAEDQKLNLFAFIYRLFHEDLSSITGTVFVPMIEERS